MDFVRIVRNEFPAHFDGRKILEVGSLDINGSIRSLFTNCDYTGLDLEEGKGVDVVCGGQVYDAPDGAFDLVISCEAMEHNPHWVETMRNMIRMTAPGGLVVMTCAAPGRKKHGTVDAEPEASPFTVNKNWNYYRNLTRNDFVGNLDLSGLQDHVFINNWVTSDLYFVGVKNGSEGPRETDASRRIASIGSAASRLCFSTQYMHRWPRAVRNYLKYALFGKR